MYTYTFAYNSGFRASSLQDQLYLVWVHHLQNLAAERRGARLPTIL